MSAGGTEFNTRTVVVLVDGQKGNVNLIKISRNDDLLSASVIDLIACVVKRLRVGKSVEEISFVVRCWR